MYNIHMISSSVVMLTQMDWKRVDRESTSSCNVWSHKIVVKITSSQECQRWLT